MRFAASRQALANALRAMAALALSPGASGNMSVRVDGGMLISPSGLRAEQATPEAMVFIDDDGQPGRGSPARGNPARGQPRPSSEWLMHHHIYRDHPQYQAIVHCHSPFATVLACQRRKIPAFHYMVAVAGGGDIPCAQYATFGSAELAENVSLALHRRRACLLANHGQVTVADTVEQALSLAQEVESLAANYHFSLQNGGPVLLTDAEMEQVLQQFRHYGQP